MKELSYLEKNQRGTPDFPIELYLLSENHPRYHMQFHWHNDIEIIHITKGLFHLTLNDRQYELSKGDSVLVPSGIVHGAIAENCVYECLVFPRSMLYVCPESKKSIKTKLINPVQFENDKKATNFLKTSSCEAISENLVKNELQI